MFDFITNLFGQTPKMIKLEIEIEESQYNKIIETYASLFGYENLLSRDPTLTKEEFYERSLVAKIKQLAIQCEEQKSRIEARNALNINVTTSPSNET